MITSQQPELQIHCLGRFEVLCAGTPVLHWEIPAVERFLKRLTAERQPSSQEARTAALWVDADAFETHVAAGRVEDEREQAAAAIDHYEQAIALYRGDYLPNDRDADWTLLRRESLKDQYLLALARLADYRFQLGDLPRAIRCYRRILRRDSCREDVYAALIQCYLQLGHRDLAARWSRRCVRVLRKRLDAPPSRRIQILAELPVERELIHA